MNSGRRTDRTILTALLVTALAHLVFTLLPHRSDLLREWGGNILVFLPFLLSALLSLRVAVRHPQQRAPWLWFALGQASWALGQVVYTGYQMVLHIAPYPSPADAFYLLLIPCFMAGLLLLNRKAVSRGLWPVLTLDTVITVLAFAGAYWSVSIARSLSVGHISLFQLSVGLAYPCADLLMLALLIVLCVWRPQEFAGAETLALSSGLVLFLLADAGYQIGTSNSSYQVGYALDPLWTFGALLFGLAALLASDKLSAREPRWPGLVSTWQRTAEFTQMALPYLALLLVLALALTHLGQFGLEAEGITLLTLLVVVLSSVRQFVIQQGARLLQRTLDVQARYDTLTGLTNRSHLAQRLQAAIEQARSGARLVAVLLIDLDHFKDVNDTFGHAAGDLLLQKLASRMLGVVRGHDIVARHGGDEFVVVLTGIEQPALVHQVAQRLLRELASPLTLSNQSMSISVSIGITLCPVEAGDHVAALKNASIAMSEAKRLGRNTVQFYDQKVQRQHDETHRTETQLRGAIERGELSVHYQPIVSLTSGQLTSCEALVRWDSPVLGRVPPSTFIPIAEQRGLIGAIGSWVLDQAARQMATWRAGGAPALSVSVNVSPLQFEAPGFVDEVEQALARHGLPGAALMLELTEGTLLHDFESSNTRLGQLRALGVRIALDDFGTGYSSLSYLRALTVDVVKIDRSFVWAMNEDGTTFVEAMVHIAHRLGLQTVAEGIETPEQRALLSELSCDFGQGYLFAPALPAVEFSVLLERVPGHPSNASPGHPMPRPAANTSPSPASTPDGVAIHRSRTTPP